MKIRMWVSTRKSGSKVEEEIEIPDEDLKGLDENEREDVFAGYLRDWLDSGTPIETGCEEV